MNLIWSILGFSSTLFWSIILICFCRGLEVNKSTVVIAMVITLFTCFRIGCESFTRWKIDRLFSKDKNGS